MKQGELERIDQMLRGMPQRPYNWGQVGDHLVGLVAAGSMGRTIIAPRQSVDGAGFVVACLDIRNEYLVQFIEDGANDLELLVTEVCDLNKRLRQAETELGQMRSKLRERSNE